MKKLLIVESPSKIKTISKFLGKEFVIMSTLGHIKDLPTKKLGVTIHDGTIDLDYVTIENKEKVIADICKQAATADEIYLAPDPDREGEIIAWHIEQEIKKVAKKKSSIHRISFNEITKEAILQAVQKGESVDLQKVAAQQARRVLDRWVGYEVSPILWKRLAPGTSAGRVQSVALRLICDREDGIRAFKPEEYWTITGEFKHQRSKFEAALTHISKKKPEITNEKTASELVKKIKEENYIIESITDKKRAKNPLPPFMTSTLQQDAFNKLGFNVKKTMQIAQTLYEGLPLDDASTPVALITYMRTDSQRIAESAVDQLRSYISKQFTKEYLPADAQIYAKNKGKSQDAHEAIRPVNIDITPEKAERYLPKDAARLYELIWRRFVACQMKPAQYAQRTVELLGGQFTFRVTGSTLIFDGFLRVYKAEAEGDEADEKAIALPSSLKEKDTVDLTKVDPKQHFTQPPPRYSEASLVKDLEKEGIGRPSTYATILNTIKARNYTALDKKRFVPTELGMMATKMLMDGFPNIMNLKFTAQMEEDLDKIAQGELDRDTLLIGFYKQFSEDLSFFKGQEKGKRVAEPTEVVCPECNQHKLAIRFGKSGEFLGCLGYPECSFTSNFKRNEDGAIELVKAEGPKLLDELCPKCGKQLRSMVGKFGPFVSCSGYPDCKYIKQNKAPFPCPLDKGDIIERRWRGGSLWGCKNYPKCKFSIFGQFVEQPCPQCKLPFLVQKIAKDGTVTLTCNDKACGYKTTVE
ncbi:MAG: type I DNA topoisomerase [Epsilonproteobacteria bacterium]|nr:type I DNA topoisomerase [Campylobacterota bacterium]